MVKGSGKGDNNDTMCFVNLLEEHKVIFRNAQNPVVKKEKEIAIEIVVDKWLQISKKKLEKEGLLKKISNLKVKAKAASNKGDRLTDWQLKLMELTKHNDVLDPVVNTVSSGGHVIRTTDNTLPVTQAKAGDIVNQNGSRDDIDNALTVPAGVKADDILNLYETPQTKLLTNEQLHRFVLLQQLNVIDLQRKKLEHDTKTGTIVNNIDFELIGFNGCDPADVIEHQCVLSD